VGGWTEIEIETGMIEGMIDDSTDQTDSVIETENGTEDLGGMTDVIPTAVLIIASTRRPNRSGSQKDPSVNTTPLSCTASTTRNDPIRTQRATASLLAVKLPKRPKQRLNPYIRPK